MVIEWDENKNQINIEKYKIDFNDASKIFEKPIITRIDNRTEYGEKRWIGLGILEKIIVVFVFTMRGKKLRIISVRIANMNERDIYNESTK
jgi:uncharacterized protein